LKSRPKSHSSSNSDRSIPARTGSDPELETSLFLAVTITGRSATRSAFNSWRRRERLSIDQSSGLAGVVV
jgi:hypothetical protein